MRAVSTGRILGRAGAVGAVVATALAASSSLALAGSPPPPAPPRPTNPEVARANEIMSKSYGDFLRTPHDAPFEWSTDGCSPPAPQPYKEIFRPACELHDFGYRNYGTHFHRNLSVTRETKNWVDGRFSDEMRRICKDRFVRQDYENCFGASSAFFVAVNRNGDPSFF